MTPPSMTRRASRRAGFGLLLVSVVLVSVAQLALKVGLLRAPESVSLALSGGGVDWLVLLALGGACYGCSMLTWLGALARLPVSLAYPMLSSSFLLVAFGAQWIPALAETVHPMRALGVGLVVIGNVAVAWPASGD